jgi:hypothetical protein
MTFKEKATDMYNMVYSGKMMDAFEKYYHENVSMQENNEAPCLGKAANRERELGFLAMVKEMHGGGIDAITSDETNGITMVQSWMDVTYQDGNRIKMDQVAVQKWDGDMIVTEKFYHQ